MPTAVKTRTGRVRVRPQRDPVTTPSLAAAADWWFDRFGVDPIYRQRFEYHFAVSFEELLKRHIVLVENGERVPPIIIESSLLLVNLQEIVTNVKTDKGDLVLDTVRDWPSGCGMFIYVSASGSITVQAIGPNDPYNQRVYPKRQRRR